MTFEIKKCSPSGGLEPPTFRLTVERASQLRHEGSVDARGKCLTTETYYILSSPHYACTSAVHL